MADKHLHWVVFRLFIQCLKKKRKDTKHTLGIALSDIFLMEFVFLLSDATVYVGGLDEKVSEPLLWELFLQAGPVVNTHMPKDRVTGQHQGKCQLSFVAQCRICPIKIIYIQNISIEK